MYSFDLVVKLATDEGIGISKSNTSFSAYPLNGRLAILRIYKGVGFTSAQVLQNYNATKGRFGL